MSKRLTETEKWKDAWFVELNKNEKLFFFYLIDNVDHAGFLEISFRKIMFDLEFSMDEILGAIKGLSRGLIFFNEGLKNNDVIYLKNFLKHQKNYPLNPFNSFHNSSLKLFEERIELVQKSDLLSNFEVIGLNRKTNVTINTNLLKYLYENKGLSSPLVEVEVNEKVKVKEDIIEHKVKIKKNKFLEIVELFNSECVNLPSVQKITPKRESVIHARIMDYNLETVEKVIKIASKNDFLNGNNERGWKADFDWIMNPNNFIKILEGRYQENSNKPSFAINR